MQSCANEPDSRGAVAPSPKRTPSRRRVNFQPFSSLPRAALNSIAPYQRSRRRRVIAPHLRDPARLRNGSVSRGLRGPTASDAAPSRRFPVGSAGAAAVPGSGDGFRAAPGRVGRCRNPGFSVAPGPARKAAARRGKTFKEPGGLCAAGFGKLVPRRRHDASLGGSQARLRFVDLLCADRGSGRSDGLLDIV